MSGNIFVNVKHLKTLIYIIFNVANVRNGFMGLVCSNIEKMHIVLKFSIESSNAIITYHAGL